MAKIKIGDFYSTDVAINDVLTSTKCGCEMLSWLICDLLDISHDDFTFNIGTDNEADIVFKSNVITVNLEMNTRYQECENNSFICQLVLRKRRKITTDYKNKCNKFYQIYINNYAVTDDDRSIVRSKIFDDEKHMETHSFFEVLDINLTKLREMDYNSIRKNNRSWQYLLYFLQCDNKTDLEKMYEEDKLMTEVVKNIELTSVVTDFSSNKSQI